MSADGGEVIHDEARRRFIVRTGTGREAVLEYAWAAGRALDLRHTWVPPEHRGRGIASVLVEAALAYAKANGYRIVATCPFVAAYVRANPEHEALLAR